jgi:hypothetical protein
MSKEVRCEEFVKVYIEKYAKVLGWSQLRAQIHEVGQGCYPIIIINDGLLYLYRQSAVTEQTDAATVTKVVWQIAKPFISKGYPHAPDFQGIQVLESHEDFVYAVVSLMKHFAIEEIKDSWEMAYILAIKDGDEKICHIKGDAS